jgi:hypothetical protein
MAETIRQRATDLESKNAVVGCIDTRRADDIMRTLLHGVSHQKAKVAWM